MADRDDMVLIPRVDEGKSSSFVRAREERQLSKFGKGRRGHLRRLAKIKAARVARKKLARRRGMRVAAARGGVGVGTAGKAARVMNPVGLGIMAAVVVGGIATRLSTGRSFANLGAGMNKALLGNLDERARADNSVRGQMQSDNDLMRAAGQSGVTDQMASIFKDMRDLKQKELEGASLINEDAHFQSAGTTELLIDAGADELKKLFTDDDWAEYWSRFRWAVAGRAWNNAKRAAWKWFGGGR